MHSGRLCDDPKISEGLHRTGGNIPNTVSITPVWTFVPLHEDAQKIESSKKNSRPATSWIKLNHPNSSMNKESISIGNAMNRSNSSIKKDPTFIDVQIPRIPSGGQSASENTSFEFPKLECSQDKFSPKKYSLEIQ